MATKMVQYAVSKESCPNPDVSNCFYVADSVCAQVRAVHVEKETKKANEEEKLVTQSNQAEVDKKKEEAYQRVAAKVKLLSTLLAACLGSCSATDPKLSHQHIGHTVSNLPDQKKATFVSLLLLDEHIVGITGTDLAGNAEETSSHTNHSKNNNDNDGNKEINDVSVGGSMEAVVAFGTNSTS